MSRPYPKGNHKLASGAVHPYDLGRERLKAAGGGLFDTAFNKPTRDGESLGPWKGEELKAYRVSPRMVFPEPHYTVHYNNMKTRGSPQWFVKLKGDTTEEERIRLAEVFMDLINTQRI